MMMFLSTVILWSQIDHEVLYSVDGIAYSLVGKELTRKPIAQWVVLTWHQLPFYEHPHLTPWTLGLSMKIFGVSTTSALVPVVLISTLTVLLTYFLGRSLIDHRYGLLAATTLALTPQFVKNGRNPMLEPALMFFIMLTVYGHIRATQSRRHVYTVLMGLSLGLAFLAKGPPAGLALAVVIAFQAAVLVFPDHFERCRSPWNWSLVHLMWALVISAILVLLVDLWHYAIAGTSFFAHYFGNQLKYTVADSRGKVTNDLWYYIKIFFQYWPWLPFILVSAPLVIWKKDRVAVPALVLGSLVTFGTLLGFTAMKTKASWYIAIHYAGSSLIAALTLRYLVSENLLQKYYVKFCFLITIPLLFLAFTFPSLFLRYPRPTELFLEKAAAKLGNEEGKVVADCIPLESYRGPFFLKFYLGVTKTDCDAGNAKLKIIDNRNYVFNREAYRILFSEHPFSIIERVSD